MPMFSFSRSAEHDKGLLISALCISVIIAVSCRGNHVHNISSGPGTHLFICASCLLAFLQTLVLVSNVDLGSVQLDSPAGLYLQGGPATSVGTDHGCTFVDVMQIHPEDAFGQQMMRNLEVQQHANTHVLGCE